jgi:O-antigen ligase
VRARWKLLIVLLVVSYAIVDVLSNRTPFEVFISYMTFNAHTAYWRVHIWNFGVDNVLAHPIFGLGLHDWARPSWMHSPSVDNFWLLNAMRYGIPGLVLIAALYLYSVRTVGKGIPGAQGEDQQLRALAFSLISIGVGICTVHLWGGTYTFFMFLLGAGLFGAASPGQATRTDTDDTPDSRGQTGAARTTRSRNVKPNYTRFPPRD